MANVFLKDWKPGDVVTAADMQALADAVALLDAVVPGGQGAAGVRHKRRAEDDGPVGLPWQVVAVAGAEGVVLQVVPGRVLVGMAGGELQWLDLPAGAMTVENFSMPTGGHVVVYLELTGQLEVAREGALELVKLEQAGLRVTCSPAEGALRVWPLAVYTPEHEQPVTQLLWGELSALECRGLVDNAGAVVWPGDRSGAAAWGTEEHRGGMAWLAAVDFSTAAEEIRGELSGCVAEDGALELYLGPWPDGGGDGDDSADDGALDDEPGGGGSGGGEVEPDGPFVPAGGGGGGGGGDEPGEGVIKVRYGYVAGDGFLSCELVQDARGRYFWELVLDTAWLVRQCEGLKVSGAVVYTAGGSQAGVHSSVEMGLGECQATAGGMGVTGAAELVFHGLNNVDASKKREVCRVVYTGSPVWTAEQRWYLTPREVHRGADFVVVERARNGWQPGGFVHAASWYRVRVNAARFRKEAASYFAACLERVAVSDEAVSVSYDSQVTAVLSGTARKMELAMVLAQAAEENQ